jgi:hypothetical protein
LTERGIPTGLKLAGAVIRTFFLCLLLAVIVWVASPQSETVWTAYETPADLVRMALGFAAGLWVLIHLFMPPKDPSAYRTWLYLGLVLLPFAAIIYELFL